MYISTRYEIVRLWCSKGVPLAEADADTLLRKVAKHTDGMHAAQVAGVCKEAALSAAREHWNWSINEKNKNCTNVDEDSVGREGAPKKKKELCSGATNRDPPMVLSIISFRFVSDINMNRIVSS